MKALGLTTVQLLWAATGDTLSESDAAVWCAYTGQTEAVAQSWEWLNGLACAEQEPVRKIWYESIERKRQFETQYHIFHNNDGYHTFRVKCVPLLNGDQSIACWAAWLTEIDTVTQPLDQADFQLHSLYRLIFEQASVGMSCRSLDGYNLEVNEQYCHILRSPREDLLHKYYGLFVHPDGKAAAATFIQQLLLDNVPVHTAEGRGLRLDGTSFWCRLTTTVLRLPSGEPQMLLSLLEDSTLEKQAAEEREHAQKRERMLSAEAVNLTHQLKAISRSITECIIFFNLNGDLLHANKAAREYLKLPVDLEHSLLQFIQNYDIRDIYDKKLKLEDMPLIRILRGEVISASQAEKIIVCQPSGHKIYLSISGAPVHDQQGCTIGGVSVFCDVTEQYEKEDRMLQALNALSTLLEVLVQVPEHVNNQTEVDNALLAQIDHMEEYTAELITQVLQCQYVSIFSLEPETEKVQIVGNKSTRLFIEQACPTDAEKLPLSAYMDQVLIDRLHANDVILCDDVQDLLKKSSVCNVPHMLLAPMFLGKQLSGIFAVGKDEPTNGYNTEEIMLVKTVAKLTALVVERVRLLGEWARTRASELALEKVNSHFDAFLNIASHELRTPLTTIKGNVQLALRRLETLQQQGVKQPETLESTLERVRLPLKCAILRTNIQDQLITDLLDASRFQANQLVLTLQYCNLTAIVCNVVTDLQLSYCNPHFHLYLPERESVFVLADTERVKQVVRNYIINAIKRSPEAAEISITLAMEEVSVRFTVHDKGLEISPRCQEHIWEPFSASTSTDVCHYTANEDLGLSLYLCNKIVEYHHGHVGLYSKPSADTAFWFVLPLAEARSQTLFPSALQSNCQ